jgi:hypothetical protein
MSPTSLAVILSIGIILVAATLCLAIGGSYLLTLHAIEIQKHADCTNLRHLAQVFVTANTHAKHAVSAKQSSSYFDAKGMVEYYNATCHN